MKTIALHSLSATAGAAILALAPVGGRAAIPQQDLAKTAAVEQGSDLARISKANGALMQRESHSLPSLETLYGNDVECRLMIVRNLLSMGAEKGTQPVGGLVLSVEEKYGSKSLYVDQDEVEGILAAMRYLQEKGLQVVNGSIVELESGEKSTEIHYATRDGLVVGAFGSSSNRLSYALRIGRTADWALLSESGADQLRENLELIATTLKGL